MKTLLHNRINTLLLILIAFFLPLNKKILPIIIVLLVVSWLMYGNFKQRFRNIQYKNLVFLFSGLYLVYLAGMLYSSNLAFGWFDLEVKFSLLLFPLLFSTTPNLSSNILSKVFVGFLLGCLLAMILCFQNAFTIYEATNQIHHLFYIYLSIFLHPGYFAMYLCFAIIILSYYLGKTKKTKLKAVLYAILILPFIVASSVFIFLLTSASGIITCFFVALISAIYIIFIRKQWLYAIVGVLFVGLLLMFASDELQRPIKRIKFKLGALFDPAASNKIIESKEVRVLIWKEGLQLIKSNPLFGVGTGDVKDELLKRYKQKDIGKGDANSLNAHNQYIQTAIALGLIGLLVLLASVIVPFWQAFKQRNYIYICFLLIIWINFLFESILETQAGVVFYAFFNSLLVFTNYKDKKL